MSHPKQGAAPLAPGWLGAAILSAVVVAVILRLIRVNALPLWTDEAYSVWFASQSIPYLWTVLPTFEPHPPFYYTLLHYWIMAFGTGEAALRSLSLLAGLLAMPFVYLSTRSAIANLGAVYRPSPVIAACIFAVSALQIEFAVQARPYSLFYLAVAIALFGALETVRDARRMTGWVCLATGMVLTSWLHAVGTFYIFALALGLGIGWATGDRKPMALGRLIAVLAIVAILYAPIVLSLSQRAGDWSSSSWLTAPTAWTTRLAIVRLFGVEVAEYRHLGEFLTLAAIGVAGFGAVRLFRVDRGAAIVLVTLWVVPFVTSLVVSMTVAPVFLMRTMLPITLPFLVLLSIGLCAVAPRRPLVAGTAALAMFGLGTAAFFARPMLEDWRGAAHFLADNVGADDLIVAQPNEAALPLGYYLGQANPRLHIRPLPAPFPALALPNPYPSGGVGVPGLIESDVTALLREGRTRRAPVIWTVSRRADLFDPHDYLAAALGSDRPATRTTFGAISIDAYRSRPRAGAATGGLPPDRSHAG
ncbi:glycosyltransferase family 39 protein [Polymorphobacter fuscus]|uniref:Glycosyltransferase RgtA/B/C/D-like domain-containing protein n=1 Tax=Sandarakinorhabdus fusca TaxID=1439888 RepID=A0A7C9GSE9_9SPHN|nr:hypothetical protein [Polymorphobacter fuscus]KAB7648214.1 hypothetical protein F9290_00365 [Polymorphobacter fuscus]MQT15718.1 hypothetical protein [Polymorphobacter fuscus]NJC08011.1 hypothetical protein [Polymorphobacter fuscus]